MSSEPFSNPQKQRTGINRMRHALLFSLHGLRTAWAETAFRQEAMAACITVPLSFLLGKHWTEVALLAGSVLLVLVVELLNTAVESVVDRFGAEWHVLSKRAKDLGSAAVLLTLLMCLGIWGAAFYHNVIL